MKKKKIESQNTLMIQNQSHSSYSSTSMHNKKKKTIKKPGKTDVAMSNLFCMQTGLNNLNMIEKICNDRL